jgi:hypothetical protein
MNPETTHAITLKIWDRSAIDQTLADVVQELATRAGASAHNIVVTRTGPNTYTASLS